MKHARSLHSPSVSRHVFYPGVWFRIGGLGFEVSGLGFPVVGFGVSGFGSRVLSVGSGRWVPAVRF